MTTFFPRTKLRASDLNDLAERADTAHIAGSGYLAIDNGFEQSVRNPRRTPIPAARSTRAAEPVPAVVTSSVGTPGTYAVDLYANGLARASTGSATLTLTCVSLSSTLPVGTVLLAFPAVAEEVELVVGS